MSKLYKKLFTRDNGLLAFELWYESESKHLKKWLGWTPKSYLLNAIDGVTEVYYDPADLRELKQRIAGKLKNKNFLPEVLVYYREALAPLKRAWRISKAVKSARELIKLFNSGAWAWSGLAITYFIPMLPRGSATARQKALALKVRKGTDRFFDDTDRIFQKSLRKIFPRLGEFSRFISICELRSGKLPSLPELRKRQKHFIFYGGELFTSITLDAFARKNGIELPKVVVSQVKEIKGQVAMAGVARGGARVIMRKKDIPSLRRGEILVTAMTTPDFVPAMKKAAAFVTDEGGITSHAAIVAREMKKPCIIGTKIATQVLRTGDMVEIDAARAVVRVVRSV